MRRKILSMLLAVVMTVGMLPVIPASAAASITKDQIKAKFDRYVSALGVNETCKYYWNAGFRNGDDDDRLYHHLKQFIATGNDEHLKNHLTESKCKGSAKNGTHDHDAQVVGGRGCVSNCFDGAAQCYGFAKYFSYYLFGEKQSDSSAYYTYTSAKNSWDSIGGLQIGDHVRVKMIFENGNSIKHSFVYYGGTGSSEIKAIQANGLSSKHPCGINFGSVYDENNEYFTGNSLKADYDAGRVTIYRYKNVTTCAHTVNGESAYVFQNDNSVVCSRCKAAYVLPTLTSAPAYKKIVLPAGKKEAPSHATPYGDATVKTSYEEDETVFVQGYLTNAFNNTWYKLATGEWLHEKYLDTHSHCYNSKGFCDECLDRLNVVPLNNTTVSLKNGKTSVPAHFAPYGASYKWTINAKSVTVNGKTVNSHGNVWYRTTTGAWIFSDYLNISVSDGRVKCDDALNLRAKPNTSSTVLAEMPNNALVTVYTNETRGSWYSVYYNGKVGYASKNYITVMDGYKAMVLPTFEEPGLDVESTTTTPTTPTTPSTTPSAVSASVLAPTDPTYTKKASVSEHNAVVVAQIKKSAGSSVTACGLWLYDANGSLIKEHRETVTNVGKNTTVFHSWYDINKEVGVTLDSGTTYQYCFFTVVNGITYYGETYSFTTKGSAPVQTPEPEAAVYRLTLDPNGGTSGVTHKDIVFYTVIGDLVEPTRRGYTFGGWYTEAEGGNQIYESTVYDIDSDYTVYAHWKPNTYRMTLNPNGGASAVTYKDFVFDTVLGDLAEPTRKGYTFDGWYTAAEGGNRIYETMRCNVDFNVTVYAHWAPVKEAVLSNPFTDIHEGSYYYDAVIWAKHNNVTSGTSATTFSPDRLCSRGQVVTFLWNSQGQPEPVGKANPFVDVDEDDWYYKAVLWAVEQGITSGTSATTFSPDVTCTTGHVLTFLWAFNGRPEAVTADPAWYARAVAWADDVGLLGNTGRAFSPVNPSPRSEIVTYLYRNAGSPSITVAD